jgi:hypothetical protein
MAAPTRAAARSVFSFPARGAAPARVSAAVPRTAAGEALGAVARHWRCLNCVDLMPADHLKNLLGLRRRFRWWHWTLLGMVVFCLVVLVVRQPLTRYATHRALSSVPGWEADADDAHISFFPLVYTVTQLHLVPVDRTLPIFYVERLDTGVFWGDLLRGRLNAWANLEHLKMTFFLIPIVIPDIAAMLRQVMPLAIERMQLKDGEITVALRHTRSEDPVKPEGNGPQLWFHDIEATVEGLATRAELEHHATTLALRGTMAHSGTVSAFVTVDLLSPEAITFSGQLQLVGLNLSDLDSVLEAAGLKIAGTFDMLARFGCDHGKLTGALQPVLKNGKVQAIGPDLGKKLEATLADTGVEVLSDRVPGRNALSTIVPVHGNLNRPKLDVWTAISGVLRNAFVVGLRESLQQLPAPASGGGPSTVVAPPQKEK